MSVPLNLHRWRPRLTDVAARPEALTAERTMEFDDFSVITYEAGMFALRTGDLVLWHARRPDANYGVPELTSTQLEQVIPPVRVVSVERIPTTPDLARLFVLVVVTGGSVLTSDSDQRDTKVF